MNKINPMMLVLFLMSVFLCSSYAQLLLPNNTPQKLLNDTIPYFPQLSLYATGSLSYICQGSSWSLMGPTANLYTYPSHTTLTGTVYVQPSGSTLAGKTSWKINSDGSTWVGDMSDSYPSPDSANDANWIWFKANSNLNTTGEISKFLYLLSFSTQGGATPPPSTCTVSKNLNTTQIPFNSTYYFYDIPPSPGTVYYVPTISPQNAEYDRVNNQFPAIFGWYKDHLIPYYKFRVYAPPFYPTRVPPMGSPNIPIMPIYFLTFSPNDYTQIVPDQLPIISQWQLLEDGMTGNENYSDYVNVVWATVPKGYTPNLYKSYNDLEVAGVPMTTTQVFINMPFVPMGSTLKHPFITNGTAPFKPVFCWYNGAQVQAFTFETTDQNFANYYNPLTRLGNYSTPGNGWEMAVTPFVLTSGEPSPTVTYIPLYFLNPYEQGVNANNHGGPYANGMRNILDIDRHDNGYSPLWQLFWALQSPFNFSANQASDYSQLSPLNDFVIVPQPIYVNCPDMGPYGGGALNTEKVNSFITVVGTSDAFELEGALVLESGINITAIFNNTILGWALSTGIGGYQIWLNSKDLPIGILDIAVRREDSMTIIGTFKPNVGGVTPPPSGPSGYMFSTELFDGLMMYWTPRGTVVDIAVTAPFVGWIALGFTGINPEAMIGSTAVLGWDQNSSNQQVKAYDLRGKTVDLITPSTTFVLNNANISSIDGMTTMSFTTNIDGSFIKTSGNTYIIASYKLNTYMLVQHDAHIPASMAVNFYTGTATMTISVAEELITAHTIIMPIAWLIILPFGVLFARYGKDLENGLWFKVHQPIQIIGFILSFIGVCIIIAALNLPGSVPTLFTVHHVNGFIIFSLSILHVIYAAFRPHPASPGEKKPFPRIVFEVLHKWNGRFMIVLAVANVFLGISLRGYTMEVTYEIILGCLLAAVVIILPIVEIMKQNMEMRVLAPPEIDMPSDSFKKM